jgi:hypothetical protein
MGNRDWKFENFEKSRLEWKFGLIENLVKAKDELEVEKDESKKIYLHQFANGSLAHEQRILNIQEKNRSD